MRRSRRNVAINRSIIARKYKRLKEIMEGFRAFRNGETENPYDPVRNRAKHTAWLNGWNFGQEKKNG